MALQKVVSLTQGLEDPKHPLLGPTIKGLYLFGLWQTGSKFRTVIYNITHFSTIIFLASQFVDLYMVRHDLHMVLRNMSLTALSLICILKCFSYVIWQKSWRTLVSEISQEELRQLSKQDPTIIRLMGKYKKYTRIITYLYWALVFGTNLLLIITPLIKYASSKAYREGIRRDEEPLPQILCSWFPFDKTKMPGYVWGVCVHVMMGSQGSGVIAVYDMNAVAIMSYLKGQLVILKEKCTQIFQDEDISEEIIINRIKECHRHHTVVVKHYHMFNDLLSPTMFLYVLVCSITICCSVIQFNSSEATASQKLWVIQYSLGLVSQLFLYCWHSNEVAFVVKLLIYILLLFIVKTKEVDRGVYESAWWKGDKKILKLVLLLAAKLDNPLTLNAGPYTRLSVPTFIDIMKGSYSFYTLFSKMQDDK